MSDEDTDRTADREPEPPPSLGDTQIKPAGEQPGVSSAWVTLPGYEIEGELKRGGMGVVYRAKQTGLNRIVALKMILAGAYADPSTRARFLLEAESVAALEHPHVVKVFAFGEHAGHPYLAMEFLQGGTLADRVKATGPLPAREACEYVLKLAGAVAHAHSRGVVHRDIKPANVLLTAEGEPRLADFGLAKVGRSDLTGTGQALGTPSYMAPEQAAGKTHEVGTSADVYALGAVLYDLLTSRPPFRGDSVAVTLQKVIAEEPERPRKLNAAIPRDLETICLKCLEKEQEKRYPTAQSLADDLTRFLRDEPISVRPSGPLERGYKWARRKPGRATAYALLLLVNVLAAIAVGALRLREDAVRARAEADAARERAETAKREVEVQAGLTAAKSEELSVALGKLKQEKNKQETLDLEFRFAAKMNRAREAVRNRDGVLSLRLLERFARDEDDGPNLADAWEHDYLRRVCYSRLEHSLFTGLSMDREHNGSVSSVTLSDGGELAVTTGNDGTARVWDTRRRTQLRMYRNAEMTQSATITGDGHRLATGESNGIVHVWETRTGRQVCEFRGHEGPVMGVTFDQTGRWLLASTKNVVSLWDLWGLHTRSDQTFLGRDTSHKLAFPATFSPDGSQVLGIYQTGGESYYAQLWSFNGQLLATVDWNVGSLAHAGFGSTSSSLFLVTNGGWMYYRPLGLGDNVSLGHLPLAKNELMLGCAVHPSHLRVLPLWRFTCELYWTNGVRCYSLTDDSPRKVLNMAAGFSRDGHTLITGDEFGRVSVWDGRPLSDSQWLSYSQGVARNQRIAPPPHPKP